MPARAKAEAIGWALSVEGGFTAWECDDGTMDLHAVCSFLTVSFSFFFYELLASKQNHAFFFLFFLFRFFNFLHVSRG